MFGSESRSKFEIVVQKAGDLFQATCSLFPQAIGVGPNEKEAVEDLADLIAYKMGRVIKGSVKAMHGETSKLPIKKKAVSKKVKKIKLDKQSIKKDEVFKKTKQDNSFTFKLPIKTDMLRSHGLRPVQSPDNENLVVLGLPTFLPSPVPLEERKLSNLMDAIIGKPMGMRIEETRVPDSILLGIPVSFN